MASAIVYYHPIYQGTFLLRSNVSKRFKSTVSVSPQNYGLNLVRYVSGGRILKVFSQVSPSETVEDSQRHNCTLFVFNLYILLVRLKLTVLYHLKCHSYYCVTNPSEANAYSNIERLRPKSLNLHVCVGYF